MTLKSHRPAYIVAALSISVLLYTLALPNIIVSAGIGLLGWIALCPLLAVIPELKIGPGVAAGASYGLCLYALSNYWLWTYHPVALGIACLYAAAWFSLLFPLLSLVSKAFPRAYPIAYPLLWISYEFLRCRGFMGYPYGVLGYAFWQDINILGLASVGGVWLVSFVALCVNSALGVAIRCIAKNDHPRAGFRAAILPTSLALGILLLSHLSGALLRTEYEPRGYFHAILLQPDYEERQRTLRDYASMSDRLVRLTERARTQNPDLIVWHETAIVPPLEWHLRFRPNRETLELALEMDDYIRRLNAPLLFGNGRAESDGAPPRRRKNWNSAFLFKDGREIGRYDKMRLVPFSETFPAADKLPGIAAAIEAEVGQFWETGRDFTVFRLENARFAVPICFEDSFGDHARAFYKGGADFLIVLTDDSWGRSAACQYHHLSQSALRAAELGIPVARAANTGATALLGPDGRILSELPPFTEDILRAEIPLPPEKYSGTVYGKIGDLVGAASLYGSACAIALSFAILAKNRGKGPRGRKNERPPHG